MQTTQFITRLANGTLRVPDDVLASFSGNVHVILWKEEASDGGRDIIDELIEKPVFFPGIKPLSRDEANERPLATV